MAIEEKEINIEEKTYTESSLAELFANFFKQFKHPETHKYSYLDSIDSVYSDKHIIEINYNDLTAELKDICNKTNPIILHSVIYRGISETFQTRYASDLESFIRNDLIKFQLVNIEKYKDKIFGDPSLIYWNNSDSGKFAGDHKINNVAKQLRIENTYATIRESNQIIMYNGKIYDEIQAETIIKEKTEKLIPDCTKNNRNEVLSKIKVQTFKRLDTFDTDSNLITVDNGILNFITMEVKEHSPKYLSRVLIPNDFIKPKFEIHNDTIFEDIEKNLQHTLFWKFLKSSFTVNDKFNKENFETILEIMASILVKHQIDAKMFIFLGSGDNGKTILLNYIKLLFDEKKNGRSISLQDISDDKFMASGLDGKSFNIFPDLDKNELKHTNRIKSIADGESITVQRKHGHAFDMITHAKQIFSCNRFPKVFDQSQGFFRRWIIVKWERNFENDPERNVKLNEQLAQNKDERNQVFSCLIYLARKLHQNGKFTYSKDWKSNQKEWNANADPIDDFVTNHIIDSEINKTKRETYKFYKRITLEKGETPLGMGQFSKEFSEYYDEFRSNQTRIWLNIDFKEPKQTTLKEEDNT